MCGIRYFALGLLLAVAGSTFAVVQGGFPSRPTFQALTVSAPAAGAFINSSTGTNNNDLEFRRAGVADVLVGSVGTANQLAAGSQPGDLVIRSQGHSVLISTDSGTSSQPVLRYAAGLVAISSGGCTINNVGGGYFTAINVASCVRNSVGDYTVSFTNTLGHVPVCVGSSQTNIALFLPFVSPAGGGSTNFKVYSSAVALTDGPGNIQFVCYGN